MSYVIDKNGRRKECGPDYVLGDGERLVAPLLMMDDSTTALHDGMGNPAGYKPGYVFQTGGAARLSDAAQQAYESRLTSAWRDLKSDNLPGEGESDHDAYGSYLKRVSNAWRTP